MRSGDDKIYEKSSLLPTTASLNSKRVAIGAAVITLVIVIAVLALTSSSSNGASSVPLQDDTKAGGYLKDGKEFSIGAVSSTHFLASEAGYQTLREGGNAVDAAAVMQFVLNVVQPQSTGIGGGCFVLLYNSSTGEASALDGREEAPSSFHENAFCGDAACGVGPCNCTGGLMGTYSERVGSGFAVGAPGVVAAMEKMLEEKGTMKLSEVVKPAVKLARDGFPMYEHLRSKIQNGEIFKNPDLANTLEALGKQGSQLFYQGQIGRDIVDTLRSSGPPKTIRAGLLTMEDLSNYKAVWRRVVNTTYRGYQVLGMSPPSAGGVTMANALNVMEGFDLKSMPKHGVENLHRMIDGMNMAWADRNKYLADSDWVDIPVRYENDEYCQQFTSSSTCPIGCGWEMQDGGSEEGKFAMSGGRQISGCRAIGLLSKDYANARRDRFSNLFRIAPVPLPPGNFSKISDDTWLADYKDKLVLAGLV
ncbi:hypothetical protein GUITHDRAFT_109538 [Guillardia theta CCMP2712]|uniref:Gamma-glutamyltransferase n=1 Tax=Guillardia theta (strain CCMP2712) TaxID=905079 RepID=L1J7W8_GUITC|nr:hypothetical protein GUITHDRAFT_109538 [Guillardia theta CCMP2712]EKX44417.1 hypothetical protein GUITHDRAFT_109538 [Guillardia theta CCMP2712]|eukprot:XP_005831397.1 hypothetical protein GUITHDRAFT_109538 [Guillardia theta CCMP2712]